jgi:hypothetical protein
LKHKITDRQLIALLAIYHSQRAWDEPSGVYPDSNTERRGQVIWRSRTNMGGAIQRMVETLRQKGYISDPVSFERRMKKPYADAHNALTFLGYEAIEERRKARSLPVVNAAFNAPLKDPASRLPEYDFNDKIDLADLQVRKMERGAREEEMKRLREEEHESVKGSASRQYRAHRSGPSRETPRAVHRTRPRRQLDR